MSENIPKKPLGQKAYGHIGHIEGSRMGPGDHRIHEGQSRICTKKVRDKHDIVIVQEKIDGSCVAVARIDEKLLALGRAGYLAQTSPYPQHQIFADWVRRNEERFEFLRESERVVGEWIAQAHGTRYEVTGDPFFPFDLMVGTVRSLYIEFRDRVNPYFVTPHLLRYGDPLSVREAMSMLGKNGFHGAIDEVEGAVWRVERKGMVDFLAKYVRPGKSDGHYLPEQSDKDPVWNWRPE